MKSMFSKILLCSLPIILFATEVMARAGGGGGGGGRGGGGFLGSLIFLITAPFVILYSLYKMSRIKIKSLNVNAALEKMARREEHWSEANLISTAITIFKEAQLAWSNQDLEVIKKLLHPSLYPSWEFDIKKQISRNERNEITGLSVNEHIIIDVQNFNDNEKDSFTVYIRAQCKDRIIFNNQINSENYEPFEEFWTFEWEQGRWMVLEVTQIKGWSRFVNKKIIDEACSASKARNAA